MVNNSTNINKTNNHLSPKESLSIDPSTIPPISTKWTITVLSPKESLNIDGQQFHRYQQNKQSPLT